MNNRVFLRRLLLLFRPHRWQPTRLPHPWDSPGKNTGVGCHCLLQCMKGKSEREVTQSCPTLSDSMDHSLPGSSIHGIFQARVLEWGAIARFIHCCIWARFPCFLWLNYIYTYICIYLIRVCMPLTLFLSSHPWTDTGCFHVSATVNSAAVHTGEQYLFEIQILFLSDEYTH